MSMKTEEFFEDEEAVEDWIRQVRRKKRIEDMRRQKQRARRLHRYIVGAAAVLLLFAGIGIGVLVRFVMAGTSGGTGKDDGPAEDGTQGENAGWVTDNSYGQEYLAGREGAAVSGAIWDESGQQAGDPAQESEFPAGPYYPAFTAHSTGSTIGIEDSIVSEYCILVDVQEGTIIASKNPYVRINPASMTKILTVLTAAEVLGIEDGTEPVLDESFTITIEITDYCYVNDCSVAGFGADETVSVRDLFYGTILPSGADAALGLAVFASGSLEGFVERMNEKLKELRLSGTSHFTNCIGLYDEEHYSTVYDMAVMLKEAANNGFCRQVLSAHTYNTSLTEQHPEGLLISNWFLRRIEDRDTHGEVLCGKTGFVNQSGSCAASLAADTSGREYLCVTAQSSSSWQCIYDQTFLFQTFLPAGEEAQPDAGTAGNPVG